jgi:D-alanyl-D-alanine carboxypeptidase
MRFYRITFIGGLAIGYVLGAQAGRERYEQLKRLARKAAESPAVQQTAGALQAQATATVKTAKEKTAAGVRTSASKVTKRATAARSGKAATASSNASSNGTLPKATGDGSRPFVPANSAYGEHGPL